MRRIFSRLREDIQAVRDRDPAARNGLIEILLTTPGLHAQWFYRVANFLWLRHVPLLPRLLSHYARFLTGIEIHPGATIGRRFFIDHGMGIVIGETTEIGNDVSLFQGVTLGGTGKETGKRHPTIEDGVTVGVGAHILGAVRVGAGAKVGGGAVVLRDVPPNTTAVGVPAHATTVLQPNDCAEGGSRRVHRIADPAQEQIDSLQEQIALLTARLATLEEQSREPWSGRVRSTVSHTASPPTEIASH